MRVTAWTVLPLPLTTRMWPVPVVVGRGVNRRQTRESIKERRTSKQACNEDTKRNNIIKAKKRGRGRGGVGAGLAELQGCRLRDAVGGGCALYV